MKLFLVRHSTSCSNLQREDAAMVLMSKQIRDPGLTAQGIQIAKAYGPALKARLKAEGLDPSTALVASSGLARASHTAKLLFGREPVSIGYIKENGKIPENTSKNRQYQKPNWPAFLRDLEAKANGRDAIVVVHGSFLRHVVAPILLGYTPKERFNNLDGIFVSGCLVDGKLSVEKAHEMRRPTTSFKGEDRCSVSDTRKIARLSKMGSRTRKQRRQRSRKQRGGGVTLPLAYFQDGAQFDGTSASETGAGLAATSAAWVRTPLSQTGGRRRRRSQRGGFAPGIMGAFVVNGARLAPMALYLGSKMYRAARGTMATIKGRRLPPVARRRTLKNRRT